ncbi:YceD family protein [Kushneria aurantia]|uniref:Large ribosomal RNA subunit accumulation protein YceD n=1 Tax=Kushneria aurantia TaxID=504092 RepID=A0ABV6G6V1_9GAMM|nr:YceD family protein [Kushneria aurantia]
MTPLPRTVEPWRLAAAGERLEGCVLLSGLPRIVEAIGQQDAACRVVLNFDIDQQRQHYIEGRLDVDVQLPCQRCLQPMPVSLESEFLLGMVTGDERAAALPGRYEPVMVDDEQLDLLPMIEDELLLTLPQVVYHDEEDCAVSRAALSSGEEGEPAPARADNPFSVLRSLKNH